jgi:hypothetical protein
MRRRRDERGAVLVEAALAIPILLLVLFAILEIGGSLLAYSGTASAARSGARAASLAGADPMADSLILNSVAQDYGAGRNEIQLIVIWHAAGPVESVPVACVPAGPYAPNAASVGVTDAGTDVLGACSVYVMPAATGGAFAKADGTAAQLATYYFGCQGLSDPLAANKLDCKWPGKNRKVLTSPRGSVTPQSTDFVGVYIRVQHVYYTKVFGTTGTITDKSISLIEPQGYAVS